MLNDLKSKLTTRTLAIFGIILIFAGNSFSLTFFNVKIHEVISNVGALILVVGVLQWFFDEESRQSLIDRISNHIDKYLSQRDRLTRLGATECLTNSKMIVSDPWAKELIEARTLAIGIHYSDGMIVRFETIIRARLDQNKPTQILHSDPDGIGRSYLSECLSIPVDLDSKVTRLQQLIQSRFGDNTHIKMITHGRVLRYSFIFSDHSIWLILLTNCDGYEPELPAFRIASGTPLFDFFKRDIAHLGANI